jgi:hypothetical protein
VRCVLVTLALLFALPAAGSPRKPSAPVKTHIESKPIPGGYEVTLVAVPTRDVPMIELSLQGKKTTFGATAANQRRELTTQVIVVPGAGVDVIGSATTAGRQKAALLRVGAVSLRAAPKRAVTHTLPDGRRVREAR